MDDLAVGCILEVIALLENAPHVGVADLVAGGRDLDIDDARGREAARQVDDDLGDRLAGHLLGGVDRAEHRGARRVEVDDDAVAHAAR